MRTPATIDAHTRANAPPQPNPPDPASHPPHEPRRRVPPPGQHTPTVRAPQLPTSQHPFDHNGINTYAEQRCLRARMNGPSPNAQPKAAGRGRFSSKRPLTIDSPSSP